MFEGKKSSTSVEGGAIESDEQPMSPDTVQAIRDEIEKDLDRKYQLSPDNVAMAEEENGRIAGLLGKVSNSRVGRALFLGAGALTIMAAKGSFSKVEAAEQGRPSMERSAGAPLQESLEQLKQTGKGLEGIGKGLEELGKRAEEGERMMEEEKAIRDIDDKVQSVAKSILGSFSSIRGRPFGNKLNEQISDLEGKLGTLEKLDASSLMTRRQGKRDRELWGIHLGRSALEYAKTVIKFEQDHPKEIEEMVRLRRTIESLQRSATRGDPREMKLLMESEKRLDEIYGMYPEYR